ncbi:MAG: aldehyde ferredoxin oxidoreductase family protein [Desulforhopalus sp.]
MTYGYAGKILRVDLSTAEVTTEEPSQEFYRKYMGGSALNLYYLLKEMPPQTDPFSPDNILALSVSGLTGVKASGLSRLTVTAKSPLTNCIGDSQSGGFFPAKMKFAGFDAIIVKGKARKPVYLWIDNGRAEIRDADHLWGKTTEVVQAEILDELGDNDIEVLQIGPAGERGVKYACILSMCCRANGRTGMGAVMGSKNLKAIAVRGSQKPAVADEALLKKVINTGAQNFKKPGNQGFGKYGTASNVGGNNGMGGLPTNNWQSGTFAGWEAIDGSTLYDEFLEGAGEGKQDSRGRDTCFGCIIRCKRVVKIDHGQYMVDPVFGGPEYETLSTLGSYCGVDNLPAVCKANELCNQYGIDTISCGATIAWAMEAFEAGKITEKHTGGMTVRFGDAETMVRLVKMVGEGEGFGRLLAEGSYRAAEKLGAGQEFLTTSKRMEAPAHMPQVKRGLALLYAMNPFGADHMSCDHDFSYTEENYGAYKDRLSYLGLNTPLPANSLQAAKVDFVRRTQHLFSLMDSANLCQLAWGASWTLYGPQDMVDLIKAVTGWDVTIEELLEVGERRLVMMKVFNGREGVDSHHDTLPGKFFNQPLKGGPSDGVAVDEVEFTAALKEYYRQCGWDETSGRPSEETLKRLGLESI